MVNNPAQICQYYICSDTNQRKILSALLGKTSLAFLFLLSFVLVKVPPPKKHQQPKKKSVIPHFYFSGGHPPKKTPSNQQKTPDPAFQQVPLTVFSSPSGRGGKNSTESGRTFGCCCLGLTFEAARAGEDHKCPTRGATVAGGGRVLGRWFC